MFNKYKKIRWEVGIMWWTYPPSLLIILILKYRGWNINIINLNREYTP